MATKKLKRYYGKLGFVEMESTPFGLRRFTETEVRFQPYVDGSRNTQKLLEAAVCYQDNYLCKGEERKNKCPNVHQVETLRIYIPD